MSFTTHVREYYLGHVRGLLKHYITSGPGPGPILNHQIHFSTPSRRFNTNTLINHLTEGRSLGPFGIGQPWSHTGNMTHIRVQVP